MSASLSQAPSGTLSLVTGPNSHALFKLTLGQLVDQQAQRYGTKDAVVIGWSNARLSFEELSLRSKNLARGLLALGVRKGDRVAVLSGDDERFIELFFAVGRIGAVLAILNKTYTVAECERALKHCDPCAFFLSDVVDRRPTAPLLERLRVQRGRLKHIVSTRWGELPSHPESTWYDVLGRGRSVTASELEEVEATVDVDSVVNIQFTSGTTGAPKAAMLSHFNITNNGFMIGEYLELTSDDFLCCGPALFHCFGLVAGLMAAFTHGTTTGFAGQDFDAAQVVNMLIKERATALHGVPTMFTAILRQLDKLGVEINTIRTGIAAGTKIPPALLGEVQKRLGYRHIAITYGMTETSPASFMTMVSDTLERKRETVGRALPNVTAKVVDERNRILPRGARGELCVSGYLLQQGYYKSPEKTAEVMIRDENGVLWMHTGDEATIDEHGYCRITGRIKDIIIRGGENIYPLEIEERLLHHPAINVASVVGVKDERYGEAVAAFLQLRAGHDEPSLGDVRNWIQEVFGRHKAPQYVFWVGPGGILSEYPVTGSGKIRKDILSGIGNKVIDNSKGQRAAKL